MKSGRFALFNFVMLLFAVVMCCPLASSFAADSNNNVNRKKGLIILVKFPGESEDNLLPRQTVSDLFNKQGYEGRNTGSVRDYLNDQSNGKFDMEFYVTDYVQITETREWFLDFNATQATSLMQYCALEAYAKATDNEIPNDLSADANGELYATIILYSGEAQGGDKGLWLYNISPGSATPINKHNYKSRRYVAGNIGLDGQEHAMGQLIHEMIHITTGTPDYYYSPFTLYNYCVMGMGAYADGSYTATPLNPLTKIQQGWATVRDINQYTYEQDYPVNANDSVFLRYRNPANTKEYFLIQNLNKSTKWGKGYPAEGIALWHVHEGYVTNQNDDKIPRLYLATASGTVKSDPTDLLTQGMTTTVDRTKWWDGSASGLMISNVSEVGPEMTITIGSDANGSILCSSPKNKYNYKDIVVGQAIDFKWTAINLEAGDNIITELHNSRGLVEQIDKRVYQPNTEASFTWTPTKEYPQRPDYFFHIYSEKRPQVCYDTYNFRAVKEYLPTQTFPMTPSTTGDVITINVPDEGIIKDVDFRVDISSSLVLKYVGYLMLGNPAATSRTSTATGAVVVGRQTTTTGAEKGFITEMPTSSIKGYNNVIFDNLGTPYNFFTDGEPSTRYLNPYFANPTLTTPPAYWQFSDLNGSVAKGDWRVFAKSGTASELTINGLGLRIELVRPIVSVNGTGNAQFGENYTLRFTLDQAFSEATTIPVKIEGTAELTTHYSVSGMTLKDDGYYDLTFAANSKTQDVTLAFVQNTQRIGNKFLSVTLDHSDGAERSETEYTHTVNITDPVGIPVLEITDTTTRHQNYGTTLEIPLTLSKASTEAISVEYMIQGVVAGTDYTPAENNLINIPAGATTATLSIQLLNPATPVSKNMTISFYNPQNTSLGKNEITIILDVGGTVITTTQVLNTGKDATGISLQWTATPGKTYQVYRKQHTDTEFTLLSTPGEGESSYKDTSAIPGILYDYYVREQ